MTGRILLIYSLSKFVSIFCLVLGTLPGTGDMAGIITGKCLPSGSSDSCFHSYKLEPLLAALPSSQSASSLQDPLPEFPSPDPPLTELRVVVAPPPWGAVSSRCWNLAHLSPRLKAAPPRHSLRGSPYAAAPHRRLYHDVTASPPTNCVLPRRAQF